MRASADAGLRSVGTVQPASRAGTGLGSGPSVANNHGRIGDSRLKRDSRVAHNGAIVTGDYRFHVKSNGSTLVADHLTTQQPPASARTGPPTPSPLRLPSSAAIATGPGHRGAVVAEEPPVAEPRSYLRSLWRWKYLVIASAIVIPAAVYALAAQEQPRYSATATIQVTGPPMDASILVSGVSFSDAPEQIISGAERLVVTQAVASEAAAALGEPSDANALLKSVTTGGDPNAAYMTVTATDRSPVHARDIANAFANAFQSVRASRDLDQINQAIARVEATHTGSALGSNAAELQRLRALRATVTSDAQVLQPASVPTAPVSPRPWRDALLALGTTLIAVIGLVLMLDRRGALVRDADELESLTGTPLVGTLPRSAFGRVDSPDARTVERYRSMATNLQYFASRSALDSIVVASALQGDGKTTVAVGLAQALASAGRDVILVDADLRRSGAGLDDGQPEPGLTDVLCDAASLDDVIRPVESHGVGLRVVSSGSLPHDPAELIGSAAMRHVLDELKRRAEIVVVDTPAALAVVDAVPLFGQVSGVVVVGRVDATPRAAIRRLLAIVENAGGTIVATVATGASEHGMQGDGIYGYGTYSYGGPRRRDRRRSVSLSVNGRSPGWDTKLSDPSREREPGAAADTPTVAGEQ